VGITRWLCITWLSGLVGAFFVVPTVGWPQEPPTAAATDIADAPISALDAITDQQAHLRERRTNAYIGLLALVGIVILGMATAAVIILWAGRIRRINRDPPSRTVVKNELWFLQPSRPGNKLPNRNPPHDAGTSAAAENE